MNDSGWIYYPNIPIRETEAGRYTLEFDLSSMQNLNENDKVKVDVSYFAKNLDGIEEKVVDGTYVNYEVD